MCGTCGCGSGAKATLKNLQTGATATLEHDHRPDEAHEHVHADGTRHSHVHDHAHGHDHSHDHAHEPGETHEHVHADGTRHSHAHDPAHGHDHQHDHVASHLQAHGRAVTGSVVELETRLLAKNDALAARNRAWLEGREVLALNLVSSPGAGKTSLLERTIRDLAGEVPILVIEGDQATDADGARIRAAGAPAVQVNTGTGCHLEADMVARALAELAPSPGSVLMIENVGNLVCPALFDLGERAKVAILSVTEGDDKPLKYPHMFKAAELMLLNKIDLLPHVDFDVARCAANARAVNPAIEILEVSARTGEGLHAWYDRVRDMCAAMKGLAFTSLRGE